MATTETRARRPRGTEEFDEPSTIRVERDGDRDLQFRGWRIARGEHGSGGTSGYSCDWNRGVKVRIWLTTGGRIITGAERWSCWQGEETRYRAAAHKSAADALVWLRADSYDGELGPASKDAWEEACAAWAPLEGHDVETVE